MSLWTSVYKDGADHRAGIVRDVLLDRGIAAQVLSKKDSPYGFGFVEVQVPADQAILAIKIIEEEIRFE